jgi:hypothetical protein
MPEAPVMSGKSASTAPSVRLAIILLCRFRCGNAPGLTIDWPACHFQIVAEVLKASATLGRRLAA